MPRGQKINRDTSDKPRGITSHTRAHDSQTSQLGRRPCKKSWPVGFPSGLSSLFSRPKKREPREQQFRGKERTREKNCLDATSHDSVDLSPSPYQVESSRGPGRILFSYSSPVRPRGKLRNLELQFGAPMPQGRLVKKFTVLVSWSCGSDKCRCRHW
jgi:hypothetical protein